MGGGRDFEPIHCPSTFHLRPLDASSCPSPSQLSPREFMKKKKKNY